MDERTKIDEGWWTTVDVLPDTGEVHIAHGLAFECFLALDLCARCTCSYCQWLRTGDE
jgi:hypothetical protein